jgi:hypothetical protein
MSRYRRVVVVGICGLLWGSAWACSSDAGGERACEPDSLFCKGREIHRCDSNGQSSTVVEICLQACKAGKCVAYGNPEDAVEDNAAVLCKPGSLFCQEGDLFECSADGTQSQLLEECADGCVQSGDGAGCAGADSVSAPPDLAGQPDSVSPLPDGSGSPPEAGGDDLAQGCNVCEPEDFYCSGIKVIFHCLKAADGCWVWDAGQACDDGNPCTDDACAANKGCVTADSVGPCDDGDPCTTGDQCVSGHCKPGAVTCQCKVDSDCAKYDDGDLCNGKQKCVAAQCQPNDAPVDCGPPPDFCTGVACNPKTGLCELTPLPDDTGCPLDDEPCIAAALCKGGVCQQIPIDCSAYDGPCTKGVCGGGGFCSTQNKTGSCDDGDPTTCFDSCQNGNCVGGPCQSLHGETCLDPIDLGGGGSFEADLCQYQQDYPWLSFCQFNGPELIFKVKATYFTGSIHIDTTGSFDGIVVAPRLWDEGSCTASGGNYGCGPDLWWSGPLGETNFLYFAIGTASGLCGIVKVTAWPQQG